MTGRIVALAIVLFSLLGGGAMYYLQVYAYYDRLDVGEVTLISIATTEAELIPVEDFEGIDADSSPLRYRACFRTSYSLPTLTETFMAYPDPVPLTTPGWFSCFDAEAIGTALDDGSALAFLGRRNEPYGFDLVVAVTEEGQGFAWPQINPCGEAAFGGDPLPPGCPAAPVE